MIHTVKGFSKVNETEVDILLVSLAFSVMQQFVSGSSAFSKPNLNIWKFSVHVLLKPRLENFEHYFANM